jgi:hypothetical protein
MGVKRNKIPISGMQILFFLFVWMFPPERFFVAGSPKFDV